MAVKGSAVTKYPFLENSNSYELVQKYLKGGSGVVTFGVKGGVKGAQTFIDNMNFAKIGRAHV